MTAFGILFLMFMLVVKHFVVDFTLQPAWMWKNKGTYGHWGGLAHAGLHAVVSFAILAFVNPVIAFFAVVFEFVVHYHMDWFKMWFNHKMGWKSHTHAEFWVFLGVDQFVHYITYILMLAMFLGN